MIAVCNKLNPLLCFSFYCNPHSLTSHVWFRMWTWIWETKRSVSNILPQLELSMGLFTERLNTHADTYVYTDTHTVLSLWVAHSFTNSTTPSLLLALSFLNYSRMLSFFFLSSFISLGSLCWVPAAILHYIQQHWITLRRLRWGSPQPPPPLARDV